MSNTAMLAALKKKRSGGDSVMGDHQDASHQAQHADDPDTQSPEDPHGAKDLHGFVASLSEKDKGHLKTILAKDSSADTVAIAKGGPSSTEKSKIAEASSKENTMNELEANEDNEHADSDAIGASMLDSRFSKGPTEGMKPRNLNDRMQMNIASKLKSKGKL